MYRYNKLREVENHPAKNQMDIPLTSKSISRKQNMIIYEKLIRHVFLCIPSFEHPNQEIYLLKSLKLYQTA